jgi:hypothetical protein
MSEGVPEARSESGELYGFEQLSQLSLKSALAIEDAARPFGQEENITVVTLAIAMN